MSLLLDITQTVQTICMIPTGTKCITRRVKEIWGSLLKCLKAINSLANIVMDEWIKVCRCSVVTDKKCFQTHCISYSWHTGADSSLRRVELSQQSWLLSYTGDLLHYSFHDWLKPIRTFPLILLQWLVLYSARDVDVLLSYRSFQTAHS